MAKASPGRPSLFTPELAQEIIARLTKGEPLAHICRDAHMPAARTVSDWKAASETFSADFACAREAGFDAIALEGLEILDAEPERVVTTSGEDKTESRIDAASVQRAKNRFEGRLKLLAKWDPKRYGDKVALTDGDGKPLQGGTTVVYQLPDNGRG